MPTEVYYSISPDGTATDKKNGSPTITISSGVMTISVAQTNGTICRGMRVTYDTSSIAYISEVTSSTVMNVITATGGTPSDEASPVTLNSLLHEYASLSACEAGFTDVNHINNLNLVTADVNAWWVLVADDVDQTTDSTQFYINGQTTDATRSINVYVADGGTWSISNQRQDGAYDANKQLASNGAFEFFNFVTPFVNVTGFQYAITVSQPCFRTLSTVAGTYNITDCLQKGGGNISKFFWGTGAAAAGTTVNITNCLAYGGTTSTSDRGVTCENANLTVNVYNTTIEGGGYGFFQNAGTITTLNCIAANNTDDINGTVGADYLASDDGDGTNSIAPASSDWDNEFTDRSSEDYSLIDTGNCFEGSAITNADNSAVPTTDIAGNDRNTAGGTSTSVGSWANGEVVAATGFGALLSDQRNRIVI